MKLVLVEWIDSHSGRGWKSLREIKEVCELLYCRSVGWVAEENKNCIILVSSLSGEKNGNIEICGCGDIAIPKKSIVKTILIKEKLR